MAKKVNNTAQDAIIDWAEDLGKLLGTAEVRAKGWLQQRQDVAETLKKIRATADRLLTELEGTAHRAAVSVQARQPAAEKAIAEVKRRVSGMSEAGRAAVSAAQKARWARIRAEKAKAERAAKKATR